MVVFKGILQKFENNQLEKSTKSTQKEISLFQNQGGLLQLKS